MVKRGLPTEIKMRHDSHYVEEFVRSHKTVGKVLPINQIEPNPEQPRTEIGDLSELSASIKQKGVLEPLLVKPVQDTGKWMIIAGERRWRAATLAGLQEVPCIEMDLDEKSIAEIALIENLQRKDLTVWEEADGLAALAKAFGYTHEEIAKKISKSRTNVTESMSIASIPEAIREKCRNAQIIAKSTLLEIARQFDDASMFRYVEELASKSLQQSETKKQANKNKIKTNQLIEKESTNCYSFISENKDFSLEINFINKESFNRKDILRALKEAFDSTKAQN